MSAAPEDEAELEDHPRDVAAERAVLGACLLSPDAVADVVRVLDGADFSVPAHEVLYGALRGQWETGYPTDQVSMARVLAQRGELLRIGGAPYLHTLVSGVPTTSNVDYWAEIVAEQAGRQRLVDAAARVRQLALDPGSELSSVQDRARETVESATARRVTEESGSWVGDAMDDLVASWDEPLADGIASPYTDLNEVIGCARPGQMVIVAGRTSMGKSVVGIEWALCAAEQGFSSLIVSLEMTRASVINRMVASKAKVRIDEIEQRRLNEWDRARARHHAAEIAKLPIRVVDRYTSTLASIRAQARECRRSERGLDLLVVDYIGLMTDPDPRKSRHDAVSGFSRGLKLLAAELAIPIIVIAQLNRGPEQRTDKMPQLSDLKESGDQEQDADMVILMFRPDYYERDSPRAGEIDLILAKHRTGPTATIPLAHQLHFARLTNLSRDPNPSEH